MIVVSLNGGLGNQMFQYAAGKALAEHHGVELALDLGSFRKRAQRAFLLHRLRLPETEPAVAAQSRSERLPNHFTRALWQQRINGVFGRVGLPRITLSANCYCEPFFHYDPAFAALGPQTSLFGYFQSERYFESIAKPLRDWFLPREPFSEVAAGVLARIESSPSPVSVHVRRGDYLKSRTAEIHGILGEPYYREAVSRLECAVGQDAELFVFSDDPAAAEQLLSFLPKSRLVHACGDPARPWEDMALMARCRHHVIANSSFSWWGAWLNRATDKVVIAPRAWFTPNGLRKRTTADLYPPGWLVV